MQQRSRGWILAVVVLALAGACGGDDAGSGRPTVVVTTSVLAGVVEDLVGDTADVVTVIPPGADPHEFAPSARQVNQIRDADVLVVNGGGLEGSLGDVLDAATDDGVPTVVALDAVDQLPAGDGTDPHFFTDPARMAVAARAIGDVLAEELPDVGPSDAATRTDAVVADLGALDAEVEATLAPIQDRTLVTDHEVFAYFADRYGFEVPDTITGTTTSGTASAGHLAELADLLRQRDVGAVFTVAGGDDRLARTLAAEVGDVDVVTLYAESLGPPGSGAETYDAMVRTNASRIAAALGS